MDAFAWGVIGSVATVLGTGVAIIFGFIPLWQNRRAARKPAAETAAVDVRIGQYIETDLQCPQVPVASNESPVIVGEIPQVPPAFQPRGSLMAALATGRPGVVLVHALTGMRGVGLDPSRV